MSDLDSIINEPTRISATKESCLDVILTNAPAFVRKSGVIETGLSDHSFVYAILNSKILHPKPETAVKRSLKHFDQERFLDDLNKVPFSTAYIFDDVDDVYWCWEKLLNEILDDHAPVVSFKRRKTPGSQFITAEIRKHMRLRDRFKRIYNKSKKPEDWENYRATRNKVVSMRRKAVKNYFTRMCEEKSGDQRKFWDTIKPFINLRKQTNPSRIILKDNGKIIKDNVEVAETLNTFFTGAGDTNGQFSNAVNQETTASNETTTGKPLLSLGKTNSIEVLEVMKKSRPNKATGHDLIPPKVIQQAAGVLCHHFSTLFNYVLDQAKIPQQWKLAEISPAHIKECKLTKSNYRQLSILPSLSKVFERLVHNRASPYFENILHKFVFAYRKFHGCDTA